MNRDYAKFQKSMTLDELIDWVTYHFLKYRKMGYEVGSFRSGTFISDSEGKSIVSLKCWYHELQAIDEMEEYLKNKKVTA